MRFFKFIGIVFLTSSCAVGSVTSAASGISGYAFIAYESESLSPKYEKLLIYKIKEELDKDQKKTKIISSKGDNNE